MVTRQPMSSNMAYITLQYGDTAGYIFWYGLHYIAEWLHSSPCLLIWLHYIAEWWHSSPCLLIWLTLHCSMVTQQPMSSNMAYITLQNGNTTAHVFLYGLHYIAVWWHSSPCLLIWLTLHCRMVTQQPMSSNMAYIALQNGDTAAHVF